MSNGQIASLVAFAGLVLSSLGITGIDSTVLTGAVNGVISIVVLIAAIWSWYEHAKSVQK